VFIEKRYIKRIENIFAGLSVPIQLLDSQGYAIVPEDSEHKPLPASVMTPGITHLIGKDYYRALDLNPQLFLICDAAAEGAENLLKLADAMLMSMLKSSLSIASQSDVLRRILRQDEIGTALVSRANEHQIPLEMNRCVVLFQIENTEKQSAYAMLGELIPLIETDTLVEMNRHNAALIKDMNGIDGIDELYQFAQAVEETLTQEGIRQVTIGIGESKPNLSTLAESYLEAKRAMEVGHIFYQNRSIHVFRFLLLERFLMDIPREDGMHYHALLFNRKTAKLFNDEMLQTIEMFFRKDLNLSDTARQLYIHRNTLVYRLDKVQRQTGLDLRKFDDAVTFKILHELKKCGHEKPKQIY
jgi:carbohydrate diacid regulator